MVRGNGLTAIWPARRAEHQEEQAMPEFILTHRFPHNFRGAPDTAAAAKAWFDQIAGTIVSRNDLTTETRKLGDCGSGTEPNAYTIVRVDNLEAALALAEG